ncbi:MAG: type II toxin-antitoxin system RelE/ParE family toxin [Acidisphaera sp.]|nr:type II toxin-antitoxin system RelE/ParE family toxin [Acidisphaera sp.]
MGLLIQPKVVKEARRSIPPEDWLRLRERLFDIARDPSGTHPGVGVVKGTPYFRVRHGDWRAVYRITPRGDVEVIKAGHRREIYR